MPVLKQLNERDPVLPVMVDDFVPASERCVNFTHSITAIIQQVESQTGAVKKILDGTDLEVSMLARHTTRTSCQHLEKVVRNTLNLMKDTDVALRAGRRMRVTSYGMYGYALLSSANFIDVSMVNNKYILSGSPFCQAPMILQGNGGYCTLTPRQWTDPADMAYRFSVEFALAAHLSVCRDVTGGRFGFSRVELVLFLLHRDRLQSRRDRREPEEERRLHPGYPSGQAYRAISRLCADAHHRDRGNLSDDRLRAA
ncbi:MAG: hypothetical protein COB00_09810 [Alcanivorax sp.]|nr:MAG: hypothetical protein COB00_09810 [Alcanivorax sp.]